MKLILKLLIQQQNTNKNKFKLRTQFARTCHTPATTNLVNNKVITNAHHQALTLLTTQNQTTRVCDIIHSTSLTDG